MWKSGAWPNPTYPWGWTPWRSGACWRQEGNRKTIHLRLTAAAAPIVEEGRAVQRRYGECLLSGFTQEERRQLARLMDRVAENVDAALAERN